MAEQNFKAMEYYMQHLRIAKAMGNRTEEGRAYRNLGIASRRLGDFKQAIDYHEQQLCIAKDVGDRAGEGSAYGNLGNAYHSVGEFNQAVWHHKQDLAISRELTDRAGEGAAHGNLGNAYHRLGDFKKAISYHQQRLSIMKEMGNKAGEGAAYGDLGNTYRRLGDLKQAIECHERNLYIAKEVGDRASLGAAYGNLGNAHNSLGQFEKAIEYHRQHLSFAKEINDRAGEGRAFCNLGNVYHALGDFKQAIAYHKEHVAVAKEVGDRAAEGVAYGNLGHAFSGLGEHKKAIEYHEQHLGIAKEVGDRAGQALACYLLGSSFESLGYLRKAIDYYGSSVTLYNDIRVLLHTEDEWKISFRNEHQHVYTALWTTLLRIQSTDEALYAAEQGRAQALMDLLKLQYGFTEPLSSLCEPKETVSYILSHVSTQTVFLALSNDAINFWIFCQGNGIRFRQKKVDLVQTSENVSTLLQNLIKDALQGNGVSVPVKCENRSLDKLRGDEGSLLSNDSDQEMPLFTLRCKNKSLRLLYDIIVGPIADMLQGDEVIIVPDGPLSLAPFAAFVSSDSGYLNDSFRIRIFPSLASLKLIAAASENYHMQNGALIVGDPCLEEITNKRGEPILPQLPYAGIEAKMIGAILKTPPLTGKEATKDEVLKQITSVALVHIAAHGDAETGEIALAPNPRWTSRIPNEKDYILKVADVQAVQLRAKLVVLSCCHSGRGTVTADGIVGIARAFLGAGARSVLVSLWAIDDEATMEFMRSFYEKLGHGHSAGLALNHAMKSLRKTEKFNTVKYWAPFVLIGDDVKVHFGQTE